jgi:16S rRNA (cytidine1402-2'-O)-methyltransferase
LADASGRLSSALAEADIIYAEDTRRTATLLRHLGLDRKTRSYFAGNENERAEEIAGHLAIGRTVALITDAGTPGIADPGLSAVSAARKGGATVSIIPGPSAVTAALAVSGLPAERFIFEGFLPRKGQDRIDRLDAVGRDSRTAVLFSSPHRLLTDLADLETTCGPERAICVTRELTKVFEEIWWGTLNEAITRWSEVEARGEFTLVLAGTTAPEANISEAIEEIEGLVAAGSQTSEAVRLVAEASGISRRRLYAAVHTKK